MKLKFNPEQRNLTNTFKLLNSFRNEQTDPDSFYGFLALDGIRLLRRYTVIEDMTVLDIGGGAGYFSAAFKANGAKCFVLEPFVEELYWRGTPPNNSMVADGYNIPFRDRTVDISFSSNVLEHVADPKKFIDEMIRITKQDGIIFFCFTGWYSPWGGHETSPWHYLGGEYAKKLYEKKYQKKVKNAFGESLFKIKIKDVMTMVKDMDQVEILDLRPRYYPSWTKPILKVPLLNEVITWNLAVIMRRK
jgi:SAM-dependent methyltransferase